MFTQAIYLIQTVELYNHSVLTQQIYQKWSKLSDQFVKVDPKDKFCPQFWYYLDMSYFLSKLRPLSQLPVDLLINSILNVV